MNSANEKNNPGSGKFENTTVKPEVYLCYNRKDLEAVKSIAGWLQKRKIRVWWDKQDIQPGNAWQDKMAEGLLCCKIILVFAGVDGISPWQKEELQSALDMAVNGKKIIIPVLLPGFTADREFPLFLKSRQWVDLMRGKTEKKALAILRREIINKLLSREKKDNQEINSGAAPDNQKQPFKNAIKIITGSCISIILLFLCLIFISRTTVLNAKIKIPGELLAIIDDPQYITGKKTKIDAYKDIVELLKKHNDIRVLRFGSAGLKFAREANWIDYKTGISYDEDILVLGIAIIDFWENRSLPVKCACYITCRRLDDIAWISYNTGTSAFRLKKFETAIEYWKYCVEHAPEDKTGMLSAGGLAILKQRIGEYWYYSAVPEKTENYKKNTDKAFDYYYSAFRESIKTGQESGMKRVWKSGIAKRIAQLYARKGNKEEFNGWCNSYFLDSGYLLEYNLLNYYYYTTRQAYREANACLANCRNLTPVLETEFDYEYEHWNRQEIKAHTDDAIAYYKNRYERTVAAQRNKDRGNLLLDLAIAYSLGGKQQLAYESITRALSPEEGMLENDPFVWFYLHFHSDFREFRESSEYQKLNARFQYLNLEDIDLEIPAK